jgi:hypothetical protein
MLTKGLKLVPQRFTAESANDLESATPLRLRSKELNHLRLAHSMGVAKKRHFNQYTLNG